MKNMKVASIFFTVIISSTIFTTPALASDFRNDLNTSF